MSQNSTQQPQNKMAPPDSGIANYDSMMDHGFKHSSTEATVDDSADDYNGYNHAKHGKYGSKIMESTRSLLHGVSGGATSGEPPSNEYVLNVAFISFVGFMGVQAFFALIANSESMLEDSEAMSVDALTYLFNMWAERIKNRPPTAEELLLPVAVREHRIELKRLYLELVPPLISVVTLICVTINALQQAYSTLFAGEGEEEEDVSAGLMLFFSGLNLVLDVVNVTCFARANQAYGLQKQTQQTRDNEAAGLMNASTRNHFQQHLEAAQLLIVEKDEELEEDDNHNHLSMLQGSDMALTDHTTHDGYLESWFGNVNLNMCSAWTVGYFFYFIFWVAAIVATTKECVDGVMVFSPFIFRFS